MTTERAALDRRRFLTRAAGAGAAAWVVPQIRTVAQAGAPGTPNGLGAALSWVTVHYQTTVFPITHHVIKFEYEVPNTVDDPDEQRAIGTDTIAEWSRKMRVGNRPANSTAAAGPAPCDLKLLDAATVEDGDPDLFSGDPAVNGPTGAIAWTVNSGDPVLFRLRMPVAHDLIEVFAKCGTDCVRVTPAQIATADPRVFEMLRCAEY